MAWINIGSNPVLNWIGVTIVIILLLIFLWYFHKKTREVSSTEARVVSSSVAFLPHVLSFYRKFL